MTKIKLTYCPKCDIASMYDYCPKCGERKPHNAKAEYIIKNETNYDRIRNMSVEEMAEFIEAVQTDALFLEGTIHDLEYPVEWKQYLESEVSKNVR